MRPIRFSVNLSKVHGSQLIRMQNSEGKQEIFIAIPTSRLFVPQDSNDCHIIVMAIDTPNSQFSDFVVKPYLTQTDYESLSQDQRNQLPILGRGKFIKERQNKSLYNTAAVVDVSDNVFDTTGLASPSFRTNTPTEGRNNFNQQQNYQQNYGQHSL